MHAVQAKESDDVTVIAIDPGPTESALLVYNGASIGYRGIFPNDSVVTEIVERAGPRDHLAIEMVESFGMAVGRDVFETVFWIGRFCEAFNGDFTRISRKDVKMHLCQSMRANDANIRAALLDKFPAAGGGKTPQVGTKKCKGPLFGIKSHLWSALAVAVTWWDTRKDI